VGYGDVAPTKQANRALAIVLIPAGLVLFSLVMAYSDAASKGTALKVRRSSTIVDGGAWD